MKLIMAIVQDKDSNRLANEFIDANIRATKLSSTGGFLKAGNSTFIIGLEDERVQDALELIKKTCQSRKQYVSTPMSLDISLDGQVPYPVEVEVGGATVLFYQSMASINTKKEQTMEELFTRISTSGFAQLKKSVEHGRIAHAYLLKAMQERANMR